MSPTNMKPFQQNHINAAYQDAALAAGQGASSGVVVTLKAATVVVDEIGARLMSSLPLTTIQYGATYAGNDETGAALGPLGVTMQQTNFAPNIGGGLYTTGGFAGVNGSWYGVASEDVSGFIGQLAAETEKQLMAQTAFLQGAHLTVNISTTTGTKTISTDYPFQVGIPIRITNAPMSDWSAFVAGGVGDVVGGSSINAAGAAVLFGRAPAVPVIANEISPQESSIDFGYTANFNSALANQNGNGSEPRGTSGGGLTTSTFPTGGEGWTRYAQFAGEDQGLYVGAVTAAIVAGTPSPGTTDSGAVFAGIATFTNGNSANLSMAVLTGTTV